MAAIIELAHVDVSRKGNAILRDLSLSLEEGETTVFMGSAGSGKSTLLKVAAGLLVPDQGRILFRGKDVARLSRDEEEAFRSTSAFVFQDAALWSNQNIFENLALPLRLHRHATPGPEMERLVRKALEMAGFEGDLSDRPAVLSMGERRLVGLARALVLDPELVFLDEPTAYLDETATGRIFEVLAQLRARGKTLVVVSSSSSFVSRSADRLGIVRDGSLAAYGSYEEAVEWNDASLRAETGRLRPRQEAWLEPEEDER